MATTERWSRSVVGKEEGFLQPLGPYRSRRSSHCSLASNPLNHSLNLSTDTSYAADRFMRRRALYVLLAFLVGLACLVRHGYLASRMTSGRRSRPALAG